MVTHITDLQTSQNGVLLSNFVQKRYHVFYNVIIAGTRTITAFEIMFRKVSVLEIEFLLKFGWCQRRPIIKWICSIYIEAVAENLYDLLQFHLETRELNNIFIHHLLIGISTIIF